MLSADLEGAGLGSQSNYYRNNILQYPDGSFLCNGDNDECGRRYTLSNGQVLNWTLWVDKPFFESHAKIESARNAYKNVLSDVGCNMPISDNHDQRMITETLNGTYSCTGSKTKKGGIIDASSESKEGDYSYYTSEKRANDFDTDLDGLPDWWENLIGTNVKLSSGDFSDSNGDPDGDGYTNLEEYLYWMSIPHVETQTNTAASIDLSSYFKGFSKTSPSYSISENTNSLNINITNGKLTVSSSKSGIFYFKIKVKDTDNDEMIRTFGIYAEGEPAETTATQIGRAHV